MTKKRVHFFGCTHEQYEMMNAPHAVSRQVVWVRHSMRAHGAQHVHTVYMFMYRGCEPTSIPAARPTALQPSLPIIIGHLQAGGRPDRNPLFLTVVYNQNRKIRDCNVPDLRS